MGHVSIKVAKRNAHAGLGRLKNPADRRWWDMKSHAKMTESFTLADRTTDEECNTASVASSRKMRGPTPEHSVMPASTASRVRCTGLRSPLTPPMPGEVIELKEINLRKRLD
jgi:hypothetical protein